MRKRSLPKIKWSSYSLSATKKLIAAVPHPDYIEILSFGKAFDKNQFLEPVLGKFPYRQVHAEKVQALINEFKTCRLLNLEAWHEESRALAKSLEKKFKKRITINLYYSGPISSGLGLHSDGYDLFILQTFGSKLWMLDNDKEKIVLTKGEGFFLDKKTIHRTISKNKGSIHLSIGLHPL